MGDRTQNADGYEAGSTLRIIDALCGKVLLVHGTSDVNATFSATMKIVSRLIEEDKQFDLLVVPEMSHAMEATYLPYVVKRVADFFLTELGGTS
jgi:dipeptidyl aminopeptidase/acylaminoacyl peptidase